MGFACKHKVEDYTETYKGDIIKGLKAPFPVTNATRLLAAELEEKGLPWFRQSGLSVPDQRMIVNGRRITSSALFNYPDILCLRDGHLALKPINSQQVKVFVNGRQFQTLPAISFEEINDMLIYQKLEDAPGADKYPELYRVFISTTHKTPTVDMSRLKWKQFLVANAVSDYPLGKSSTFSMNQLLEATFFSNKLAFVTRTKNEHLKIYDEFAADIDLYINGLSVKPSAIEEVHVREVDKLYTRERSFEEWADGPNRQHRFTMYIQTTPKRAKRDSTYYVFSPFYTGDF
ncbi:hypothetical protein GCM10028809_24070 [Spirosoma gilvum]